MDKFISILRKPLRFLCLGFAGAAALFALIMVAMSMGGDAEDIISGLIGIIFILGLGGLIVYGLATKKDKIAFAASVIALGYYLVSHGLNAVPFVFAEGFIAYNIFHLIGVLALLGAFALMVLAWLSPSFDDPKYRRIGLLLMLCFAAMEIVAALILFILSIVYAAQGGDMASYFLLSFRDIAWAGAACFGYLFFFVPEGDFKAADPVAAPAEPAPAPEPEPAEEPAPVSEPEPVEEPKPVEEPVAPEEPAAEEEKPE